MWNIITRRNAYAHGFVCLGVGVLSDGWVAEKSFSRHDALMHI